MHRTRTRTRAAALAAGAVAAAALAVPATAPAAYTGAVAGTTVTLTGDTAADTLAVTAAGGVLQHNLPAAQGFASASDFDSAVAGVQSAPADGTVELVVNAGAGDDTVTITLAATDARSVTVDGGAGNDLLTGSAGVDTLRGGDNNDRVIGFRGDDAMLGGNGDDTLVWNNGDNSDDMEGEAGQDEVEVNGAATAGDDFTIKPDGAARVRFDRLNLVPFNLEIGTTERLAVDGQGGDDVMRGDAGLSGRILLLLGGGVGADSIAGGDGPDLIAGGADNDALQGAGGDDRVLGDRGDDAMRGGAGDDVLVWNNGDNSDVMDGEEGGDVVEVNGAPAAGDAFTLAAQGARARFDRTNLVPFSLSIATTELLDVRGLGGDDAFTPAGATAAVLPRLALDGGSGNDRVTGADSADAIAGGTGDDQLDGAAGSDSLDGGDGNDRFAVRDGIADLAVGRAGTDSAVADAAGVDALDTIEAIDRPAAADTVATPVRIASSRATVDRRGAVRLRLSCPAGEPGGCAGTLSLSTAKAVTIGRLRATVVLGAARFALRPGQARAVTVRLAPGHRSLARRGRIAALARTASRDAAGNRAESSRRVKLRLPGRRR